MAKEKAIAEIRDGAVYILQSGTPVYVKTADIAAMTSKSNQWIGQLCSQGTMFKKQTLHGGMFEVLETMKSYCTMLETRTDEKNDEERKQNMKKLEADADLRKAKAAIAKVEANELLGKIHRSEDVAAMTEEFAYAVRGALLALPGRLAVDVINAANASEASEIIRKEIYHVLEELSTFRYDPAKYQERVRQRRNMSAADELEDEK